MKYTPEEENHQGSKDDEDHICIHIQPVSVNHHYNEDEYNEGQDDQIQWNHSRITYVMNSA